MKSEIPTTKQTKLCSVCGPDVGEKPLSEFSRDRTKKYAGGYTYDCLECRRARSKAWYALHKEWQIQAVQARRKGLPPPPRPGAGPGETQPVVKVASLEKAAKEPKPDYTLLYLPPEVADRFRKKLARRLKRQPTKEEFDVEVRRICRSAIENAVL